MEFGKNLTIQPVVAVLPLIGITPDLDWKIVIDAVPHGALALGLRQPLQFHLKL